MDAKLAVLLLLAGCAAQIPYTREEHCASEEHVFMASTVSSGNAMAHSGRTLAFGHAWGNSTTCRSVESERERCLVAAYRASLTEKERYNSWNGSRDLALTAGYILFVLPGVVGYYVFKAQADERWAGIASRVATAVQACTGGPAVATVPPPDKPVQSARAQR